MRLFLIVLAAAASALAFAADVPGDANDVRPLLPGMMAPAFEARTRTGEPFVFDPAALKQPVIIMFYRGGWCPYCNAYLAKLRLVEAELRGLGYDILFLSADKVARVDKTARKEDLYEYTLLSDASMEVAQAFGVAFRVDDKTFRKLRRNGYNLEKRSGYDHHILPVPSAFLVGTDGLIRFQYANPNYKVRLDPQLLLTAARLNVEGSL